MARRRSALPSSVPSSRERQTFRLRLLPPGPGQVRPLNARAPPYESTLMQPSAPRGRTSTEGSAPYASLPLTTLEVTDPPCSPLEVRGRAGSPVLPATAPFTAKPTVKALCRQYTGYVDDDSSQRIPGSRQDFRY